MNKKHNIMIFNILFIGFHFELVVKGQTKDTFWDVLVDN